LEVVGHETFKRDLPSTLRLHPILERTPRVSGLGLSVVARIYNVAVRHMYARMEIS